MKLSILLFCLGFLSVLGSCKQDKVVPLMENCNVLVSYQESIEPLILNSCGTSGCHAVGGTLPVLTNYNQISVNSQNILIRMQLDPTNVQLMPFGGPKLADSIIQNFECWIEQGTLDN